MLFPTTLILSFLSIAPALAIPILDVDSDALVARDEPQSLEARGGFFDIDFDMMEKRDIAGDEMFEELVARSPEPEPEPLPMPLPEGEIEDMERRWLGALFKIGKAVAKGAHKAHRAHQHRKNHKRSELEDGIEQLERRHLSAVEIEARSAALEPRSKIGRKIKNFFKKVGKGIVKGIKTVAKIVMKRSDDGTALEARSFDEPELEVRAFDEPEIETRDFEEPELETRSVEEPELEARDFDELELEARDFDEQEIEARTFEEEEF